MYSQRTAPTALIFLTLVGLSTATFVLFAATPIAQAHDQLHRNQLICMLLIGSLGLIYWIAGGERSPGRSANSPIRYLIWLPPTFALFQIIPLPIALVRLLSPARSHLSDALTPVIAPAAWMPLSVTPSATLFDALLVACCVIVFLIVYDLASSTALTRWTVALPLIVIGAAEAALGLIQTGLAGNRGDMGIGTFTIRNHYAGLLEMTLPFAILVPLVLLRSPQRSATAAIIFACFSWAAAALILVAIISSFSRMGFVATVSSLALLAWIPNVRIGAWPHNIALTAVTLAGVLAIVLLLSPARLVDRFAEITSGTGGRGSVWFDSLDLIRAYPLFGCGLGGFGSAFTSFKRTLPTFDQDYAHNDYVQYLAELGVVGFALFAVPIVIGIRGVFRRLRTGGEHYYVALAGAGAIIAIGLHSFADFNLYVPANRIVFAWALALSAAAGIPSPESTVKED